MMDLRIRAFSPGDTSAVIELSLLAWAPVFSSFAHVLGSRIYAELYPDWRAQQRTVVERVCTDLQTYTVFVAEVGGRVVGFIAYTINGDDHTGEVYLLAVHPDIQNRGIGTALNTFVLDKMRAAGARLAVVGTGGDPGHAPARRSYEKAGYTPLPLVRYYQPLE
jgi:GNAT superfamily N-acetyltransferase